MKKTGLGYSAFRLALISSLILTPGLSRLLSAPNEKGLAKSEWKIEDVIHQEYASGFAISPDGAKAVWVKSAADEKKDRRISHLFLTLLDESQDALQLTRGEEGEHSPKWSPSGKLIGFLSSRKSTEKSEQENEDASGTQLWLLDLRGGEPWQATNLAFGVRDYEWIDDNQILLLSREDRTFLEQEQKKRKDTSYVAEDQEHMPPVRLFFLDLKKKKIIRVTENNDQITNFALSHDKNWVLTRNNQSVRFTVDQKIKPRFFLINLKDRSSSELFADPAFKPGWFVWDLGDKGFYFSVTRTSDPIHGGPGADFLYYFNLETKSHEEVPLGWEWGLFYLGFEVRRDGFVASLANGALPKWRRYYQKGDSWTHQELEGEHYPQIYSLTLEEKGDRALYQHTTASQPAQWFLARLERNILKTERLVTSLNSHLKDKVMAKAEVIWWVGALDEEIEGVLYYPHHYQEGKRYPLILMIHGGPTGVDLDAFRESWGAYPNLMAQRGAFVLRPNYHGSAGYGQKFAESIKGHYYEYEIPDMLKGIDELVKKGMVDPDQLGTMGWSNGGILTVGLTVWTDRFKVAGVGAADVNWISDYGNCAFGVSFDNYYFKGPFWEELDHYIQKSPLFHLKNMAVPTIIFHGTEDTNVPYGQGWEYYRTLEQLGKAPVKFVIFPGQPHGLGKLTHQHRKMKEELEWFEKYFFKTYREENEAFKKGSPLDLAFKKKSFAKVSQAYGKKVKGRLIPETVMTKDLEVGRFEVTRGQWAAFDPGYAYEKGTENYPVSGITFEKARHYADWLKRITGEDYRLPSVEEAEALAGKGKEGNTLDYWAGYALNSDDARLLLKKAEEFPGLSPLLVPVDWFDPAGEELIFGLAGNVAEWAAGSQGEGKILGRSAVTPLDSKGEHTPPLEYVGLRVVKARKS